MKQAKVASLLLAGAACSATAMAAGDDVSTIRALEARVAQLEAASQAPASGTVSDKIRFNGFMSAGFGMADLPAGYTYDTGLYHRVSHKTDSVVGLQMTAAVNEQTNAVLQLVGRGAEDFSVDAEWAYIGYRPTENDEIRFGRLRTAFYLLSEYLEVGYAHPWARPPAEVYLPTFPSSYDGLYYSHEFATGDWQHDLQFNWGSTRSPKGTANPIDAEDAWGVALNSSVGDWQFGIRTSGAKLTAPTLLPLTMLTQEQPIDHSTITYSSAGFQYDNGGLMVMSETTRIDAKSIVPDYESSYLTVGYHFGKVMPHLTYAVAENQDERRINGAALCAFVAACVPAPAPANTPFPDDIHARVLGNEQTSATLGVRWDFLPSAALKVEWTRVLDTENTFGLFERDDGNRLFGAMPGNDIDVYRATVDVVF